MADHDEAAGGVERLPAVRPHAAPAPVDRTAELSRRAESPLLAVPMMAVPMVAAAATQAMLEAIAAMWRSWLTAVPVTPPPVGDRSGPGVHISYTHVELHWPTR